MKEVKPIDPQLLRHLENSVIGNDPEQAAMDLEMIIADYWDIDDYKIFLDKITYLLGTQISFAKEK